MYNKIITFCIICLILAHINTSKQIHDLQSASKAAWYELEQFRKQIKLIDEKMRPESIQKSIANWLEGT